MRVNRAELIQTLTRVDPGVSSRDFLEQSSSYVFSDGWLATFNGEVCCRTKSGLPADLVGAVRAKPLKALLENLSDDEVDLEVAGNELRVRGHRKRAGIRLESEILLPVEEVEAPTAWTALPEDFGRALEQVLPAAGTNDEEFLTVVVHVHPDYLEACDRTQASRYDVATGVSRDCLVRAASLAHARPLEPTKVGETDNWLHFRNKTTILSCRRHLDTYPDISKALAARGVPTVLPRGAAEAAKLGAVFAADNQVDTKVQVELATGRMTVRGEGAYGWASAVLETTYKGEWLSFRVAPALLARLVAEFTDCEVAPGKLVIRGERWQYMALLDVAPAASAEPVGAVEAVA